MDLALFLNVQAERPSATLQSCNKVHERVWRRIRASKLVNFDSSKRRTAALQHKPQGSTLTEQAQAYTVSLDMLRICRPCILSSQLSLVWRRSRPDARLTIRAAIDQKAMTHVLGSKSLLDDQSFGGDLLNRSVGDRRDESFVKASFEGSTSLLVTGRSVMAKQAESSNGSSGLPTELCWLAPEDLQEYGIEAQTDSQTTVTGEHTAS